MIVGATVEVGCWGRQACPWIASGLPADRGEPDSRFCSESGRQAWIFSHCSNETITPALTPQIQSDFKLIFKLLVVKERKFYFL